MLKVRKRQEAAALAPQGGQGWPGEGFLMTTRTVPSTSRTRMAMMVKTMPTKGSARDHDELYERVAQILEQARGQVARSVNTAMVQAYWLVGCEIVRGRAGRRAARRLRPERTRATRSAPEDTLRQGLQRSEPRLHVAILSGVSARFGAARDSPGTAWRMAGRGDSPGIAWWT